MMKSSDMAPCLPAHIFGTFSLCSVTKLYEVVLCGHRASQPQFL